ncbi:MAG: kelch-like protein [Alphaproteobacteria bacterium]|nr:kelch-like protein [Alphaproteobacteria bacterium]
MLANARSRYLRGLGGAICAAWLLLRFDHSSAADLAEGAWGKRAELIEANSEFALAEWEGSIYVVGGYPASRRSVATVQIYDVRRDAWRLGPPLPQPNNHGMAAAVNGVIYLIGGQTDADQAYVDTVYAFDPQAGRWVEKARMPTKRSAGVALVHAGKIYVAGGRPRRGQDFAVYDPAHDAWETLPDLPSPRNHIAGAAIDGRLLVVGGRLGGGFQSELTAVAETYDPVARRWTAASPMLRPRSGINGVLAHDCFHVWGGEHASGVFADHDVYNPRTGRWTHLSDMPIPVHGVTGATFVDGLIWVVGGGTSNGGSSGSRLNQVYRPAGRCER